MFTAENRGSLRSPGFGAAVAVLLVVVLLLVGAVQAGQVVLGAGDFPYNASTGDTITLASGTVTIDGSGIQFWRVHDIVIDGDPDDDGVPDTLVFNAAGNGDDYAIKMKYDSYYGYVHDVVIKDLVIKQFEHADPATGEGCEGITMTGSHDILFENVDVSVYTRNSRCVYNSSSIGNFRVSFTGGTYNNYSHQYTNRCHYYGAAIYLNTAHGDSGKICNDPGEFSYYLRGVNVRNSHGQGIITGGKSFVVQCTVYTNHRNTLWDNCDWGEQGCIGEDGYELGVCQGSANPYGIMLVGGGPGSRIDSNFVRADTTWGGGRGILVENSTGSPSCYIQLTGNDVSVHEGADKYYSDGLSYTRGLALREIDAGTIRYIHVFNNTFAVTGKNIDYDTVAADTMYAYEKGGDAAKFMFGYSSEEDGDGCHVIVENNIFRARSLSPGCEMTALHFRAGKMDSTIKIRNNTYETDVYSVRYHTGDSSVLRNPVFKRLSPDYDSTTYLLDHLGNDWSSPGHQVVDPTYTDGADEVIDLASNNGSEDITLRKTLEIAVEGGLNGEPVVGAHVTVENAYGNVVIDDYSDGGGLVSGVVSYEYRSRTETDSTEYNDFTIIASTADDADTLVHQVVWNSSVAPLVLPNTEGGGSWEMGSVQVQVDLRRINDTVFVDLTNSSSPVGDSVVVCFSVTGYQDSSYVDRRAVVYEPGDSNRLYWTVSGTESYTAYVSAWVRDNSGNWSERRTANRIFDNTPPAPTL